MVAVTLFFSFSSISFPSFFWSPLSFSFLRTYSRTYLSRGRWYCHLVSVEQPPTRARPGHAICPRDTCWTLATVPSSEAATPGPVSYAGVYFVCVPIVWNRILVRDAADVWTASWKKAHSALSTCPTQKSPYCCCCCCSFLGVFFPLSFGRRVRGS
jgi:hypothetical protein